MPRWFRRAYRKWARHQLDRRGYLDFLAARPRAACAPDFSDLWFLYKVVRNRKPRCILEFGSGCSTVIMAQAVWENQRESTGKNQGVIYSVDANRYWAGVTIETMPEHLNGICQVIYSSLTEVDFFSAPAWRHANLPDVVPDFLYLDGPALTPERRVAVDVLEIENRLVPGFLMVIDGRKENTQFLMKHLKRRYKVTHRRQFRNSTFELVA